MIKDPATAAERAVVADVTSLGAISCRLKNAQKLSITLVKSGIDTERTKRTLKALGFRHLNETVVHEDSEVLRGMLAKVSHLVLPQRLRRRSTQLHDLKPNEGAKKSRKRGARAGIGTGSLRRYK